MADDPNATNPPVKQPNTPRVWLGKLWTWGWAHTVASAGILGVIVGYVLAKL